MIRNVTVQRFFVPRAVLFEPEQGRNASQTLTFLNKLIFI
jgi:hypothetical protein